MRELSVVSTYVRYTTLSRPLLNGVVRGASGLSTTYTCFCQPQKTSSSHVVFSCLILATTRATCGIGATSVGTGVPCCTEAPRFEPTAPSRSMLNRRKVVKVPATAKERPLTTRKARVGELVLLSHIVGHLKKTGTSSPAPAFGRHTRTSSPALNERVAAAMPRSC